MNDERKDLLEKIKNMNCSNMKALLNKIVEDGSFTTLNSIKNTIETTNYSGRATDPGIIEPKVETVVDTLISHLDKSTLADMNKMNAENFQQLQKSINMKINDIY